MSNVWRERAGRVLDATVHSPFFRKMMLSFMAVSLVPTVILTVLLGMVYTSAFNRNVEVQSNTIALSAIANYQRVAEDMVGVAKSLASEQAIIEYLISDRNEASHRAALASMQPYTRGEKGKIEVSIVGTRPNMYLSSGSVPNIYRYKDYGVLHDVASSGKDVIVQPNQYLTYRNEKTCLTVGATILKGDEVLGYVLLDLYRSFFLANVLPVNVPTGILRIVYDDEYVMIDTSGQYSEGMVTDAGAGMTAHLTSEEKQYAHQFAVEGCDGVFNVMYQIPVDTFEATRRVVQPIVWGVVVITVVLCLSLAATISANTVKPVLTMNNAMSAVAEGNLEVRVSLNRKDELAVLETGFNGLVSRLESVIAQRIVEANTLKEAQLASLQAQINPHFLYNTLGTIKAIAALKGVHEVSDIVLDFCRILRFNIHTQHADVLLAEELEMVQCLFNIQNLRYQGKYTMRVDCPENLLTCKLPPLLLQPLVENALVHGLERTDKGGVLSITVREEGQALIISVYNDGECIPPAVLACINGGWSPDASTESTPVGVGIRNCMERIWLLFGEGYGMKAIAHRGRGTEIIITIAKRH